MAGTRGDERTDVPVSVAELCRRLGPVPATADSLATGSTPVLVGDLLRREGRPAVQSEIPETRECTEPGAEPGPDAAALAIPVPRRRGEACKTALGAGGLVVAGSVLGAALLAAAGVGGPLPSGGFGDEGTEQFQGEGTVGGPGVVYGSVRGRDVVASSGLLKSISYFTPWADTPGPSAAAPTAVAAAAPGTTTSSATPAVVPVPAQQGVAAAPASVAAPGVDLPVVGPVDAPAGGGLTAPVESVVNPVVVGGLAAPVTQVVGGVVTPVVDGVAPPVVDGVVSPVVAPVIQVVDDAAESIAPVAEPVVQVLEPVVTPATELVAPVVAAVAPATTGLAGVVEPVADLAGPVITSVAPPVVGSVAPLVVPTVEAVAPLLDTVAPVSQPVVAAMAPAVQPVLTAVQPAVAPVLDALRPGLDATDPLLGSLTDPILARVGTAADALPPGGPALPAPLAQVVQDAPGTVAALPGVAGQAVQGTTDTVAVALPDATTVTETATGAGATLTRTLGDATDATTVLPIVGGPADRGAPPALRTAEAPTLALPVVAPQGSDDEPSAAQADQTPTTVLRTVVPTAAPDLGELTIPLPIVDPTPAQALQDAAETGEEDDDAAEDGAQAGPTDTPEPSRAPIEETVSGVTDVAGGLLGGR